MSGIKKGLDLTKKIAAVMKNTKSFDRLLSDVNFVSAENGKLIAELTVKEEHCNHYNSIHGGFLAYLVDSVTTTCQMTFDQGLRAGLSVDMHLSFQKAAMLGETIRIEATTVKTGKNLAFLDCVIKNKKDNSVLATGTHTKFTGGPYQAPYLKIE